MSSSLLRGPEQNDTVDVSPDAAPSQVSVLNSVNAETRDPIVSFLHWDDENYVEADAGAATPRTAQTVDFSLNTPGNYSPALEAEIRRDLDRDEDAVYLSPAAIEKIGAKPDMQKVAEYIQSSGRYRSQREVA